MKSYRLVFASDLHGSDLCFQKLLHLAETEKADAVLIAGDLSGKTLTPVVETADGAYEAHVAGTLRRIRSGRQLADLESDISATGSYPIRVSTAEQELLRRDARTRETRFQSEIRSRLRHWLDLAASRLKDRGARLILICGNDDQDELDQIIAASPFAENPEGNVVTIGDTHEVIGESHANDTPWHCPRDVSESKLRELIEAKVARLKDPGRAIFMFHTPPINSGLDTAPALDADHRILTKGGDVLTVAAGSTTVLEIIQRIQPMLTLHGHIHESGGFIRIGRTLCCNAGSEYWTGVLRAMLITIDRDTVVSHQPLTV